MEVVKEGGREVCWIMGRGCVGLGEGGEEVCWIKRRGCRGVLD